MSLVTKQLTKSEVLAKMKKQQGKRTAREYAAELGISPAYLSDIYAGKREPGPAILDRLGLVLVPKYEPRQH